MAEQYVRSVKKALDALDFVVARAAGGAGASLTDIAAHLGEKTTTVRNILKTMEACGYLGRDGKAYCPGVKCGDARRGHDADRLKAVVSPLAARAAQDTGDSFVLTTLLAGRRAVLARWQGGGEVVVNLGTADASPLYTLVTTHMLLAGADADARAQFLAVNGAPPSGDWPEADAVGLDVALADLAVRGRARSEGPFFIAHAVTLTDAGGRLLGVLGAYSPRQTADVLHEEDLLRRLLDIARMVRERW